MDSEGGCGSCLLTTLALGFIALVVSVVLFIVVNFWPFLLLVGFLIVLVATGLSVEHLVKEGGSPWNSYADPVVSIPLVDRPAPPPPSLTRASVIQMWPESVRSSPVVPVPPAPVVPVPPAPVRPAPIVPVRSVPPAPVIPVPSAPVGNPTLWERLSHGDSGGSLVEPPSLESDLSPKRPSLWERLNKGD